MQEHVFWAYIRAGTERLVKLLKVVFPITWLDGHRANTPGSFSGKRELKEISCKSPQSLL